MADAAEPSADEAPTGNVTRVVRADKEIYLLGTAHVSRHSVDEVHRTIDEIRPDAVCVELDRGRYETLADDSRFGRVDIRAVLASGRAGLFLSSLLFAGFQKRIGDRLGVRPGAEMLAAVEAAKRVGAEIVFADREVQITLIRCYASLGFVDKAQVLFVLVMLPFAAGDVDEEEVERLKSRETIGDVMTTFAEQLPALKTPLIDERDLYLASSITKAPGRRVVAVVGAAHLPGVERSLDVAADTTALEVVPEPSERTLILRGVYPVLAVVLALSTALGRTSVDMALGTALRVAIPVAVLSALFLLAAGASIFTAFAGSVLSPASLVIPVIRHGAIVGAIEHLLRPPVAADGLAARDDVLSPKRARKSRFIKPLLAAVASSFGRNVGAVAGLVWALLHVLF